QSEASGASELRTQKLDYFPDRDLVKSDRRVELTSPGHRIDAIGLKADLDRQVFELRRKVKGLHHVPD
ncbi:MAG TPA: LPS export ABC transporter periplasmic protein LptC, partial [Porticoccaceae bacterium]|nr:LPS export ABC transporter periplasmic protein LptC [Porticoccaceae bacterium]